MIPLTSDLAQLAFDDATGVPRAAAGSALPHALAATLVLDLVAAGSVELGEGLEVVATPTAPDDPLLRSAWDSITADTKVRSLRDWVAKPTRLVKPLPGRVYDHLVELGVLADDGRTRVFRRERYREVDPAVEQDLVATLGAVLDGDRAATGGEVLLLALLPVCRLTRDALPGRDRTATERRIDELVREDGAGAAVDQAVTRAVARSVAAAVAAGVAAAGAS